MNVQDVARNVLQGHSPLVLRKLFEVYRQIARELSVQLRQTLFNS